MNVIVYTYIAYLLTSIALTVWVAKTLHRNGRVFLVEVFHSDELADSVNHLLVVGFYLVNLGYVALALRFHAHFDSLQGSIEALSGKLGGVLLVLGFMHFVNLYVFSRLRKTARLAFEPLPVTPDDQLPCTVHP